MGKCATIVGLLAVASLAYAGGNDLEKSFDQARGVADALGWDLGKPVRAVATELSWASKTGVTEPRKLIQLTFEGGVVQLLGDQPFRLGRYQQNGRQAKPLWSGATPLGDQEAIQLAKDALKAAGQQPYALFRFDSDQSAFVAEFVRRENDAWILPDVQRVGLVPATGEVVMVELAPNIVVPPKPSGLLDPDKAKDFADKSGSEPVGEWSAPNGADGMGQLVLVPKPGQDEALTAEPAGNLEYRPDTKNEGPPTHEARLMPNAEFVYAYRWQVGTGPQVLDIDAKTGAVLYEADGYRAVRGPVQVSKGASQTTQLAADRRPLWIALALVVVGFVAYRLFRRRAVP